MNTTAAAAALEANVTVATIRTWCRAGVIAASKVAGRWVIDSASLAHRIAIAAMRTRKATVTETPTKPQFVPFTRAEFYRDNGDPAVRIQRYPNKDSFGETLFNYRFPMDVYLGGGFTRTFNDAAQAASEAALTTAGWSVTSDWTKLRGKMIADIAAL